MSQAVHPAFTLALDRITVDTQDHELEPILERAYGLEWYQMTELTQSRLAESLAENVDSLRHRQMLENMIKYQDEFRTSHPDYYVASHTPSASDSGVSTPSSTSSQSDGTPEPFTGLPPGSDFSSSFYTMWSMAIYTRRLFLHLLDDHHHHQPEPDLPGLLSYDQIEDARHIAFICSQASPMSCQSELLFSSSPCHTQSGPQSVSPGECLII
jgi:hypothetical protein